jgi:hypothetical protein
VIGFYHLRIKNEQKMLATDFAVIFWVLWKTRNKACFKGILSINPASSLGEFIAKLGWFVEEGSSR